MIDTHTHLFLPEFSEDIEVVMQRAQQQGVSKFLLPNVDIDTIAPMHALVDQFPETCFAMMGLHPCSVTENFEQDLVIIKNWFAKRNYCAVGEIGLDLYWDKSTLAIQKQAFIIQTEWAKEMRLPVVIHVREAFDETLALLDKMHDENLSGVFHCFTGSIAQANHIISYGNFKLGIGGVVTFKNSGLDQVIKEIDLKHLVLETDSPYLAPVPYRGKRNESGYLQLIAQKIADIKTITLEEVIQTTTNNALAVFSTVK
ncbi:MAG: TatD family hydrolase [Crocinitomicaceae bacterium]|nr:TatD family hydrolase [Crocinitomicaceae bacterium]MBK8927829.1 TatD family hydrolase [Crocinitomicaceae bacterium]